MTIRKEIWAELLNRDQDHEESLICFQEYFTQMKEKANGFDYRLATDRKGYWNGVVWQTATKRENFRLFGTFLSLDAMKRAINKLLWPYFVVVMINDLKQICLACESIMCSERNEAYSFMISSLLDMSIGCRGPEKVFAVAGDGFFSQEDLANWGLTNARFIADHWHLLTKVLPKRLGEYHFNLIDGQL